MRETTPDLTRISKYISLILRHKPEVIGIKLDTEVQYPKSEHAREPF